MILVKLGGSVITNKETIGGGTGRSVFYKSRASRLIGELAPSEEDLILVHGAGSFGHPLSKRYRLKEGYADPSQLPVVARVQEDVRKLNLGVIRAMREKGLPAIPISPNAIVELDKGSLRSLRIAPFRHYLDMGVVPVTFGDVVPDLSRRFGICSGDDLMLQLAKELKPRIAIFVTKVDGIYTKDPRDKKPPPPEFIPEINEKTIKLIGDSEGSSPDVTGRMLRKARMMLRIAEEGVDCLVLNGLKKDRLRRATRGEDVRCTRARGRG